jgi:voltage-gated potassium channel
MGWLTNTPFRNLFFVVAALFVIGGCAVVAYMMAGWSAGDALYMVLLTVYTVGYGEVHPIDTPYLHVVTMATIVFGCTGMIVATGVLVQALTFSQIRQLMGANRMRSDISKLTGHVVVCGYGRIGVMLARDLAAGRAPFVILERDESRVEEARTAGYLAIQGDATDEGSLRAVGIERATVMATVLPGDATNVFITLTARGLNAALRIIARGEAPSTEKKLIQAGADQVILPTHISAERIASMILYPHQDPDTGDARKMREVTTVLRDLGLELEVTVAAEEGALVGQTVAAVQARGGGGLMVVAINRKGGETVNRPDGDALIGVGDGVVTVGRPGAALGLG